MCKYCDGSSILIKAYKDDLDNLIFFAKKDNDMVSKAEVVKHIGSEEVNVSIDRGYLRLTYGEDIACLDHSEGMLKINFCPVCGELIK